MRINMRLANFCLTAFAAVALTQACASCIQKSVQTADSPVARAVVFRRTCGSVDGFGVHILPPGATDALQNGAKDYASVICSCDVKDGVDSMFLEWITPTKLKVRYDKRLLVRDLESHIGKIEVEYEPIEWPVAR